MARDKFLPTGLLAILAVLYHCEAQPSQAIPDCTSKPDGYKLPGKNPANFYFCQNGSAIPMFCPPGFNFCYSGQTAVCAKWCTNVTPEPTESPCETPTTSTPGRTDIGTQSVTIGTTLPPSTQLPTGPTTIGSTVLTTNLPATLSTQTTTAPLLTTTPAPPNPETVCGLNPTGSIFSIAGDCSAFGVCIFGKVMIGRCLGGRQFDPVRGTCTGTRCK